MESPVPESKKRLASSSAQSSDKKRRIGGNGKKEIAIWNKEDEMILLQCLMDFNKKKNAIFRQVQKESLLKSVSDSLPNSVSQTQMYDKIHKLKKKYNAIMKRVNDGGNTQFSNAQDAAFFDLPKKIWGASNEKSVLVENNLKVEKVKQSVKENGPKVDNLVDDLKEEKVEQSVRENGQKVNNLLKEYPFLCWHVRKDLADNALVMQSNISVAKAKELDESWKKLEIAEIQLHRKKMNLLSERLKLIEDAIKKL